MNTFGEFALEDIDQSIIALDQHYFPMPWTTEQWHEIDKLNHQIYTVRSNSKLEAFALIKALPGDNTSHLYKIVVVPEKRGIGVATYFWMRLVENLRTRGIGSIYLEVETLNQRAISFYQKQGFNVLRLNKGYYSNGSDALAMLLTL